MPTGTLTISQYVASPTAQLNSGDLLEVRGWYSRDYISIDGVTPIFGNTSNGEQGPYYFSTTPTLNGSGNLVVPAHIVQITVGANPTANYFEGLWVNGAFSQYLMPNTQGATGWQIPSVYGDPIAYDEIATYNRAKRLVYAPDTYFTADETIAEIRRLAGDQAYAAVGVNGITSISVAPVLASLPIAVGDNDPRVSDASTTNKGITKLSFAPVLSTNPIALSANDPKVGSYVNVIAYGAVGDDATDNTTAFTNAQTAAAITGAALYIPVGIFRLVGGFGFTSPVAFAPGASVVKHVGGSLTFSNVLIADTSKHFATSSFGAPVVTFSSDSHLTDIYPQWWGAVLDNATDDADYINAAITSLGTTATTRGGPTIWITGPACIASTILINRKSIVFAGLGWGRQGSTGQQSYLRWIGSAGSPMLRLQNVQGVIVENLHLIGNASAKPSCAISLFQQAGFGINQNVLQNIAIGDLNDGTAIGTGFTLGIAWEGATANNDTWQMSNILIQGCSSYGLRQNSIQNVVTSVDGLTIVQCGSGIYVTAGQFTGRGWSFGSITGTVITLPATDDQSLTTGPVVTCTGFISEASGRLAEILGTGSIKITNGHMQYGSFTATDGKLVVKETDGLCYFGLSNFSFQQVSSPTVTPFLSFLRSSYFNQNLDVIELDYVSIPQGGPQSNGISAATRGYLDQKYIYYRDAGGNSVDQDGAPVTATTNYLSGYPGGGPGFALNRQDFPNKIRYVPTSEPTINNNITAAGNAIVANRHLVLITNTTGGSITLTSTPTIADGSNGEVIRIINTGTQNVVLQDQGTLPSSNLRLTAASITLGPLDSIELTFLLTTGGVTLNDWVQTGVVVNVV